MTDIFLNAKSFPHIMVWSGIWQGMGFSSILYISILASVSPELHEAAIIDGASRFQRILHIDFPALLPTATIMLIMSMGGILKLDRLDVSLSDGVFEIILVKNPVNAVEVQKIVSSLTRQQFDTDLIEIFRADRAVFEMDEPLVWTLDGERAPGDRRMVIDIIPGAIEIML